MLEQKIIQELLSTGLNVSEVAQQVKKPYHVVYSFIRKNNIPYSGRENNGKSKQTLSARKKARKLDDEALLRKLYVDDHLSMGKIAKLFNTTPATVLAGLNRYGIPTRLKNGKESLNDARYPKQLLEKLYYEDKLSLEEISEMLEYPSSAAVQYDFKKHNILRRDYQEAGKLLYEKRPEKRELHRKQFYDGLTGPKSGKITSLEQKFIDWADSIGLDIIPQFQIRKYWHRYDFKISNTNVLVEMDGLFWHSLPEHAERDYKFDETARRHGYVVVRITDKEVEDNPNIFDSKILHLLEGKLCQYGKE